MEVHIFDKTPYEGEPNARVREVLEKLHALGKAVIAVRDKYASANIVGIVWLGLDGRDLVIRGDGGPEGECSCHVHVMWSKVVDCVLRLEDVTNGLGPEPVIYLVTDVGEIMLRIFYPHKTFAEIEALLV
ncbi:MAG: hypothetical protein HYT41_02445 [Candidatus Sungbacteria bacterium]|nr:hypothetical protein [Candidatus Sungbacteria bacterium]